jgi:hypothetical protein
MFRDAIEAALVFGVLIILLTIVLTDDADAQPQEQVRYCYDRSSFPTKVAIVCPTCQCPPGYY